MQKGRFYFLIFIILFPLLLFSQKIEVEKDFTGEAKAKEFSEARKLAYVDVVRKALLYIAGENEYKNLKENIEKEFLVYENIRRYIVGETESVSENKKKKWVSNYRDAEGNLVLKLQAFVKTGELKRDYDSWKEKYLTQTSSEILTKKSSKSENIVSSESEDFSNVDISSITMLVFYNPRSPVILKNPEEEIYARWAVEDLNKECADMGLQIFDLETMEKLSKEREILQQSEAGNIGIGLLLAERVFAELYTEVTPAVNYQGTKAHVILNVKVFVRTTGALIANIEKGGQEYDSPSVTASIKASMREATKKVRDELAQALKKYVGRGRFYFVRITGIDSYKQANSFVKQLEKIDGVVSVKLKSGSKSDRVYDYNVQYKGNPTELIDILLDTMSQKAGFESFDLSQVRGNELIFTLE
ncbi:MAG: hypothetical protein ACP5QT_00865 [Brevinematia bacterium]